MLVGYFYGTLTLAPFLPGPGPDPKRINPSTTGVQLPHILARGIISVKEADDLFTM